MSTTLYSAMGDEVQLHTESVPRATLVQAIRRVCIILCRQSRVWKMHGSEVLVPGEDSLCIDSWVNDAGTSEKQLIGVEELRYEGKPLRRFTEKQLCDLDDRMGSLNGFYQPSLTTVELLHVPDQFLESDDSIDYNISVAPSTTSTGMDAEIMERYWDGIVSGAVGTLFGMPRKTWSSPDFAIQYMSTFAAAVRDATTDANQEFARRVPRVVRYGGI